MRRCIFLVSVFLLSLNKAFGQDPYQLLADEIVKYSEGIKKVAVIPFSYADNIQSTKDGSVIAERLSMKLINLNKFEVIERTQLDKVLQELKLQNSGIIDATSAKELGKILGVDAIITGTLVVTANGKIEVNARIIKTDTAQAIGAVQAYVVKDWIGGDSQKTSSVYPSYSPSPIYIRGENEISFFDFIYGFGKSKVDITPDNNYVKKGNGLTAKGVNPLGIRMGGYGKGILGFDFEISYSKHQIEKQDIFPNKYLDIGIFNMYFDMMIRVPENKKLFGYFGVGLGFGMGNVRSDYIYDSSGKKLDETFFNFAFRFPIGVRFVGKKLSVFAEYRFGGISFSFDRGYSSENNSVGVNNSGPVVGLGTRF